VAFDAPRPIDLPPRRCRRLNATYTQDYPPALPACADLALPV
ncbi:MAG: hypothetical protein, partial [Olavius algarvensis Gamma 1 endosymbiont]